MRELRTSGSVGAPLGNQRGYPTRFYYVNYSGHLRDADSVAPTPLTVNHRRCDAIARRIDRVALFERSPLDFLASEHG
jgi:hypothetical protein